MVCYVTSLLHLLKKDFCKSLHHSPGLGGQIYLPAFSHPGWGTALPRGLVTCSLRYRQLQFQSMWRMYRSFLLILNT